MISELEEKTERLREMLMVNSLAGVLLNAQHNFAWLSGGASNGIDLSREGGAGFIFVRADGRRFLMANNIELSRLLAEEVSETDFEPVELSWQQEKASSDAVFSTAKSLLQSGGDIATDLYLSARLKPIEPLVSACRYQLTPAEIDRYRKLGSDAAEALSFLTASLSPGDTEIAIANNVRSALAERDIFPVVVLVGADARIEQYRHPVATSNLWKKNLLIAVCARRQGLIASLSRIVCAGDVPPELHRRTEAAADVNARLQAATRPGMRSSDLYTIAASAYEKLGFTGECDKHHQGGACGYRTRDWLAHPAGEETVSVNQAFAWNPSITGTKTEVTGIAAEDGFEVMTPCGGFPQVVTTVDGRDYSSPGVLSLSKGVSA